MSGPAERVLPTLNRDGSRRWLRPKLSRGAFHRGRLWVGWGLIALFVALPFIQIGGRPTILLDIIRREFTLFGVTLYATDTFMLLLGALTTLLVVFWITALFGRIWCGWGCPQTVYMEFLFRPLETWIEGGRKKQMRQDRDGPNWRRLTKYVVFAVLATTLSNVFLAYFVGVETLVGWMQLSPFEHPTPFAVMALTSGLIFFDFAFFREQMCVVACPYARLQSVLLDKESLIIGYDTKRGEPRGKKSDPDAGDCVACNACVVTCPTGIDIRDGLQLECIGCAQCIDACDSIMDKIDRPRGLIRYDSQRALSGATGSWIRARAFAYPIIFLVTGGALFGLLWGRQSADLTILRGAGTTFAVVDENRVSNHVRIKLQNRERNPQSFQISLVSPDGLELIAPDNPFTVKAGATSETSVFVVVPNSMFVAGRLRAEFRVQSDAFDKVKPFSLLGPFKRGGRP